MTMRSVTLEVPANHSLLRKTGRADVWLEPLIGDIEKKKMESHSCLTLMNDVVHSTLKANLIGTELMGRISLLERKARESEKTVHEAEEIARGAQLEATNWKEQFENAQGTIEELQEDKNLLEQQNRGLTSELATVKASSSQLKRDKELLECSLSEQLSRASEEVRELKALLARKEEYAGELVQSLTQAQADLQTSSDEIHALKSSHASLEASLDSHLAEYQILKNDLAMWEKEYGLLEENFNIEVNWAFLKSRRDALTEAAQEGFDLQSELAKVIDTIEKSQQSTDTPSPALEVPGTEELLNEEVTTAAIGITIPASAETVHVAASSEVLELCQVLSPNPSFPVQLKFDLFYLQLFPCVSKRILTMSENTPSKLITRGIPTKILNFNGPSFSLQITQGELDAGIAKNMALEKRTKSRHDNFKQTQVEKSLKETRLPIAEKRKKHISPASSVKGKEVEASKSSDTLEEKVIKLFVKKQPIFASHISHCEVQHQLFRCFMALQLEGTPDNIFVIHVNGTLLSFSIKEFALVSGLKYIGNDADFEFSEKVSNWLIENYFRGANLVKKKHLMKCFAEKNWGHDNDGDALKIALFCCIHLNTIDAMLINIAAYLIIYKDIHPTDIELSVIQIPPVGVAVENNPTPTHSDKSAEDSDDFSPTPDL
uniref:Uncharacterized protein LOC104210152 n=1 Tax=Nicotiana sylvestris TaxID=4096 RepID=A0A1U7UM54_NICSY|nr:PREDICTED: uncharacterized protein LOC104210152 [Nicotiana sylvestris]